MPPKPRCKRSDGRFVTTALPSERKPKPAQTAGSVSSYNARIPIVPAPLPAQAYSFGIPQAPGFFPHPVYNPGIPIVPAPLSPQDYLTLKTQTQGSANNGGFPNLPGPEIVTVRTQTKDEAIVTTASYLRPGQHNRSAEACVVFEKKTFSIISEQDPLAESNNPPPGVPHEGSSGSPSLHPNF